jgi:tetratricopeptide (TPR) repeat protein
LPNPISHSGATQRRCLAGIVAASIGGAGVARADEGLTTTSVQSTSAPASDLARAKAALELGQKLYDEAKHEAALVAFEEAYRAYPVPDLHYNIGLCHERLGNTRRAIAAFEAYIAGAPDAPDRPSVEHRIGTLRDRLAPTEPEARPVVPPPGEVPMARVDTSERPANRASTTAIDEPRPAQGRGLVTGGSIALVLGIGAGVGGGLGFGLPAKNRRDALDRSLADDASESDRMTEADARRTAREGDRFFALQLASVGLGAVLVGTGIGLMVAGKRRQRRAASASFSPTPGGIALSGRF